MSIKLMLWSELVQMSNSKNGNPYERAYQLLLSYWDCFTKEQKLELNNELNKIFGKEHKEYVDE